MWEPIARVRSAIRKNSRYNIFLSLIGLNLMGVVGNTFYFQTVIEGYQIDRAVPIVLLNLLWSVPLGFLLYLRRERPITLALHAIKGGVPLDLRSMELGKEKLQRRPRFVAVMIFVLWVIASGSIALQSWALGDIGTMASIHIFVGGSFITTPIISLLSYLMVEQMSRNDMRVLEIPIEMETLGFRVRNKILFTMILLATLFIALMSAVAYQNMRDILGNNPVDRVHFYPILATAVIAILYSVLAAWMVARSITAPLAELLAAMNKVQQGAINTTVHITSTDEIAVLSRRFNTMTRGLVEREQIRKVFGHYVSAEIRDEILAGKLELGGREVQVTVLFADIRNFTAMSEKYDPAAIVTMLNQYFSEMVTALVRHGGVVDKFIGDAIMALFGAPRECPDHAAKAIAAAQEMLRRLEAHNELQRVKGEPEFEIGIGINTGPVIVGNLGSDDRREYTAIGDTVNTAARIESLTKELHHRILFSSATYQHIGHGDFVTEAKLKGKAEPVRLYTVTGNG